jgi:hypothetical protein
MNDTHANERKYDRLMALGLRALADAYADAHMDDED